MGHQPKYSIIIPHKNIPHLLRRCLSTIPICKEIQIVIVDDDSDPTIVDFKNIPGFLRFNTQVILTKEAKGAGFARNIGLRYAKGEWLIFADADDYFNDCFLEAISRYVSSTADVIYFSASSVDSETLEPATRHHYLNSAISDYDISNLKSVDSIKYFNWEPWSKMFNHSYIKSRGILFDEVMVGNDLGFVIKAGHYSREIAVDKSQIYCVTYRKDSLSHEISEAAFDNRYRGALLVNEYMRKYNKGFRVSLFPHISRGLKYGPLKFCKMLYIAILTRNNIFVGSKKYIEDVFLSRQIAIKRYLSLIKSRSRNKRS